MNPWPDRLLNALAFLVWATAMTLAIYYGINNT